MLDLCDHLRFDRGELAGSLGDLGIFVPIAGALILTNHLNATAVLAAAGLLYVASGFYFRVPVPVQPLKATAAIAIATGASAASLSAAALIMGGLLLFLSVTGTGRFLARCFDRPVVRGIQLSLGIILLQSGWQKIASPAIFSGGGPAGLSVGSLELPAGLLLAAASALILLLLYRSRRLPASIAVLAFGALAGLAFGSLHALADFSWGPSLTLSIPDAADLRFALFVLVLPQIPLTFGNSVIATEDAARKYYGDRARKVRASTLCASLGIANLLGGLAGAMPMCHGSGGVTAHYRFGARTGGATVIIGAVLLLAGIMLGSGTPAVFSLIPLPVLGFMLMFIGFEHSLLVRDLWRNKVSLAVALAVAAVSTITGTLIWGLAAGLMLGAGKSLAGRFRSRSAGLPVPPRKV